MNLVELDRKHPREGADAGGKALYTVNQLAGLSAPKCEWCLGEIPALMEPRVTFSFWTPDLR